MSGFAYFLAVNLFLSTTASEILVGVMPQGKSHAASFMPLLQKLIQQGHNVTIYMENYGVGSLKGHANEWFINVTGHKDPFEDMEFARGIWYNMYTFMSHVKPFRYGSDSCTHVLNDHRDQFELIRNHGWDLILTDSLFAVCAYGLALLSPAHHIVMHSTDVESGYGISRGYSRNYLTMPTYFADFDDAYYEMTHFKDRLRNAYEWLGMSSALKIASNRFMQKALSPILQNFDISNYYADSAYIFSDMPLSVYTPMATNNELFMYGAYCQPYRSLTRELAEFVEDPSSRGTILIAFGTIVNWSAAPQQTQQAIADALNELSEYRIIWTHSACKHHLKRHIKLMQWMPQNDLLNHNRTKLFHTANESISSTKEGICATVPMLFIPLFAEQLRNAWLIERNGCGKTINKVNLTKDSLVHSMRQLITEPRYKENMQRLRAVYDDSPMPAIDEAAFKMNRLLKFGGRMPQLFYTRSINLSYFTVLNIDLIILIPLSLIFALCIK
ncbi:unnamed protein product [Anisakis simplex]|uniref:glucuronosyltransferase n=1 Tax=Anisakis simplex TaxID=6269 RepID=A0A0M3K4G3_ANISI|nr:unnamed protein product [Anisakis simplex]